MKLKDFKAKYMGAESKWNFKKFSIKCEKCGSCKVEFNGYLESEGGYYGEHSLEGAIIVKCHDCGNAFRITTGYDHVLELNASGESVANKCFECGEHLDDDSKGLCDGCSLKQKEKKKK